MSDLFDLYQNDNPASQGLKDWAIKVSATNELTVMFGKSGSKLRTRVIKLDQDTDARSEMLQRVSQKISDGYYKVGKARIDKGKVTLAQDIEKIMWSMSELDEGEVEFALKSLVDGIVNYSFQPGFSEISITAEYDINLKGVIINCNGLLPSEGWHIVNDAGLSFLSGGKVMGGGSIDYSFQLLLLLGLSYKLPPGSITVVATKANNTRDLMPSKKGLPADFIEALELPKLVVREIAQAVGIIPMPIKIVSDEVASKPAAICF